MNKTTNNSKDFAERHLTDDEIIAYQYGKLSSPQLEQQFQIHLIKCRRCTDLLLEMNEFTESTAQISPNNENLDEQWAQFQMGLKKEQNPVREFILENKPKNPFLQGFFDLFNFNFATAAFAVLLLMAIGIIFFVLRNSASNNSLVAKNISRSIGVVPTIAQNKEIPNRELQNDTKVADLNNSTKNKDQLISSNTNHVQPKSSPKAEANLQPNKEKNKQPIRQSDELALNTTNIELYPDEAVRGETDLRKVRIERTKPQVRLKLNAPMGQKNTVFLAEIIDSQNKSVFTSRVSPTKSGNFNFFVSALKLPADVYILKIYTADKEGRKLFTSYTFKVE